MYIAINNILWYGIFVTQTEEEFISWYRSEMLELDPQEMPPCVSCKNFVILKCSKKNLSKEKECYKFMKYIDKDYGIKFKNRL